jgi:threonine synthase
MDAKAVIDASGVGCEPASAASVAGAKKLREKEVIARDENIVCILTGNLMKDSDTTVKYHLGDLEGIDARRRNKPIQVEPDLNKIEVLLQTTRTSPTLEVKTFGV